jgi:LysR family transcriptional regulator, glycine cleavage system transcriptional activator
LEHVDFAREDVDLAVRHGDGQASGLHVTRLCAEELFQVCSPKLLENRNALRTPAGLRGHMLLHVNDQQDWSKWLETAGIKNVDPSRGPVLYQASMAIDAAIDGEGVALARTTLAAWDLIGGRLVRPFAIALPASFAYWIVCPKAIAKLPKIRAFTDWLRAEATEDVRRLQKLRPKSQHAKRRSN